MSSAPPPRGGWNGAARYARADGRKYASSKNSADARSASCSSPPLLFRRSSTSTGGASRSSSRFWRRCRARRLRFALPRVGAQSRRRHVPRRSRRRPGLPVASHLRVARRASTGRSGRRQRASRRTPRADGRRRPRFVGRRRVDDPVAHRYRPSPPRTPAAPGPPARRPRRGARDREVVAAHHSRAAGAPDSARRPTGRPPPSSGSIHACVAAGVSKAARLPPTLFSFARPVPRGGDRPSNHHARQRRSWRHRRDRAPGLLEDAEFARSRPQHAASPASWLPCERGLRADELVKHGATAQPCFALRCGTRRCCWHQANACSSLLAVAPSLAPQRSGPMRPLEPRSPASSHHGWICVYIDVQHGDSNSRCATSQH